MQARLKRALRDLLAECRTRETIAVLLVTAILVTRHALHSARGGVHLAPLWSALAAVHPVLGKPTMQNQVVAVVLQLLLPLLFIYLVHRGRAAEFGLGRGEHRFWLPITAVVLLIQVLVVALYLSDDPTYIRRYPTLAVARQGGAPFWIWEASRVVYMLSWELLFRGYLLFALAGRMGRLACAVQTCPFALMHIVSRKPTSEIYFTIFSGLVSGFFAHESRSIWPVVLLHAVGAVLLDVLIVY
jgi:membrane protease YdiL (CAAX protease family)